MAQYSYTNKALLGNWYEDRLDKSHAPIPELERTGKYRVTPLKMIETTPDLYVTTNQAFHCAQPALVAPPRPQFLTKDTLQLALQARHLPAEVPRAGFGAPLPRHDPSVDQRVLHTSTHSAHGGRDAEDPAKRIGPLNTAQLMMEEKVAGAAPRAGSRGGIRTAGMTDERLQLGDTDPKSHSLVQRSWLGHTSLQGHVEQAALYAARRNQANVPGLALKGLGEQRPHTRPTVLNGELRYFKKNDTLRRDTGIWDE